jgi:hypothetical protein
MNVLGAGTDVFGPYAVESNVKGRILDVEKLNAAGQIVHNPDVQEYRCEEAEGRTVSEYVTHLAVSTGVTGSYMFFSAEVKAAFSQDAYRKTEYSYASIFERHWKHSLKLESGLWTSPDRLRPYLTSLARQAIDDTDSTGKQWSGADVIAAFGTHVMTGIYVGARLDYHLAIQILNTQHQTSLMAYAKAKYASRFASAGVSVSIDAATESAMDAYSRVGPVINAKGGAAQYAHPEDDDDYQLWKASLDEAPVFCGVIQGGLLGVWELAPTPARRAELLAAYEDYAEGQAAAFVPLAEKITDLVVLNAGTGTSVTPPTGYALLRSLSGDTVAGDLSRDIWYDTRRADHVYVAYKSEVTAEPVGIASLHVASSDAATSDYLFGGVPHDTLYGVGAPGCTANGTVDLNATTCGAASIWDWYSGWCAVYFWSAQCTAPGTPLFLHHVIQTSETEPIRCIVLGDEVAKDSNQTVPTRSGHIWWGPSDVNHDGNVGDAADAAWVLDHVTWVSSATDGTPVNVNLGTQSYHRYDWYDCGLGQGYDEGWIHARDLPEDAQYIGVCYE